MKNKDIPVLYNYRYHMREVEKLENQISWEHDRKINISQHITGMPSGKGGVNDLSSTFARIDKLEHEHRKKVDRYRKCALKADAILDSIESVSMRVFVRMKYLDRIPDVVIRQELNMSRRSFDKMRDCVESASSMAEIQWEDNLKKID